MTPTLVCDLDGVVYVGETAVPGSARALERATDNGWNILFATNNSSRPPRDVVAKLERMTGYIAREDQVVTSALVAASLITAGPVLVMGEEGVVEAVLAAGFEITDDHTTASTVIVGLFRAIDYDAVHRAAAAVRAGAHLIVTNRDPTLPSERGLVPGAGACAAPIEVAAGKQGVTAGKPTDEMRRFIEARAGDGPIWMVGDRLDTDIAMAWGGRWRSVLVASGVPADGLSRAVPDLHATDLAEAVEIIGEAVGKGSEVSG